jgi:hypothetical protein
VGLGDVWQLVAVVGCVGRRRRLLEKNLLTSNQTCGSPRQSSHASQLAERRPATQTVSPYLEIQNNQITSGAAHRRKRGREEELHTYWSSTRHRRIGGRGGEKMISIPTGAQRATGPAGLDQCGGCGAREPRLMAWWLCAGISERRVWRG